jgi:hypothetical protein
MSLGLVLIIILVIFLLGVQWSLRRLRLQLRSRWDRDHRYRRDHPRRITTYGSALICQSPNLRNQSFVPPSRGTSRSFFWARARSIAFSAAATASDLIASWPIIATPATDADHSRRRARCLEPPYIRYLDIAWQKSPSAFGSFLLSPLRRSRNSFGSR